MPIFLHAKMKSGGSEPLGRRRRHRSVTVATGARLCERLGSGRVSGYIIGRCELGQYRGLDRDQNCRVIGTEWNG